MKRTAKRLIARLVGNRFVWFAVRASLGTTAAAYTKLVAWREWNDDGSAEREQRERERFAEKCRKTFSGLTVLNGPFRGMRYPALRSAGSTLYPKLLGSYEKELHGIVSGITRRDYESVVDIGCAEGYYAIGLGQHLKNAQIYAYDTDPGALKLCQAMAALNNVRVNIGGFCNRALLMSLNLGKRALIISDCEAYENELFDEAVVDHLKRHDFLIETHDFLKLESTRYILDTFSKTHNCEVIESVDDILKAYTYDFDELRDFDLQERLRVVREGRPAIMRWVFATSRHRHVEPANTDVPHG